MGPVISFTPEQLIRFLLAVCGAITAVGAAAVVIAKLVSKIKKPNLDQNVRLDAHEKWLKRHDAKLEQYDQFFDRDKCRIDAIEEGNRVTQRALLALLANALDGSDKKQVQDALTDLQEYLIHR